MDLVQQESKFNLYFISNRVVEGDNIKSATIQQLKDWLQSVDEVALDIETCSKIPKNLNKKVYKGGLDPYLSDIVLIQIGNERDVFVIDVRKFSRDIIYSVLVLLDNKLVVGHNLKFEYKFIKNKYNYLLKNTYDTMVAEMCMFNGLDISLSLEGLSAKYIGTKSSKEIDLFFDTSSLDDSDDEKFTTYLESLIINKATRLGFIYIGDKEVTLEQIYYSADDIVLPLAIKQKQSENDYFPEIYLKEQFEFTKVLGDVELRGMYVDTKQWLSVYENNLVKHRKKIDKLNQYILDYYGDTKFVSTTFFGKECNIQWSSSKQVIDFFRYLGICPKERSKQTGKEEWTVGEKAMVKLIDDIEFYNKRPEVEITDTQTFIINYLQAGKLGQLTTTFGKSWLKYIHPITKRVHSSYKQIVSTGRMSSTNPNLQNIPNTEEFKLCFNNKYSLNGEEVTIVNADYSSQEIRVLAYVSGDEKMISFYRDGNEEFGDDFHSFVANDAFKIIYKNPNYKVPRKDLDDGSPNPQFKHKSERNKSKEMSFKIMFGGSAGTLADSFRITRAEGQKFYEGWLGAFPSLKANFEEVKNNIYNKPYILIDSSTDTRYYFKKYGRMKEIERLIKLLKDFINNCDEYEVPDLKIENKQVNSSYEAEMLIKKYESEFKTYLGEYQRKGLNYRIQGLAGRMTKKAGVIIRQEILDYNAERIEQGLEPIDMAVINIIHDEILGDCPKSKEAVLNNIIQQSMEKAGSICCPDVPFVAQALNKKYWGH